MKRTLLGSLLMLVTFASGAHAQSLFATRGLGIPTPALDGRARALGGIGVGIIGVNASLINPAELAGLTRRGVTATLQPVSSSARLGDEEGDVSGSRFPLVQVFLPFSERLVAGIGYGSALEQSWGMIINGQERVGTSDVDTRDDVRSAGGLAQLSMSVAYSITPNLAVGAGAGLHTGGLSRTVTRTYPDTALGLLPFRTVMRWEYQALFARLGVRWEDASHSLRVASSLLISENLDIRGREGGANDENASLPVRFSLGATGVITPLLLLSVGTERTFNGAADRVFSATNSLAASRDTWRLGGGLEYIGVRSGAGRTWPVRLGGGYAQLPYFNVGETPAKEWYAGLGLGYRLAGAEESPLAVVDAGVERGGRSGLVSTLNPDGLSESFWRFTFSLSVFGR
jgi:long-subunit fatty acid transport protein